MTQTIKPATPLPWSVLPTSDGLPAYVFSGKKYTHTAEVAVCYGMGTSGDDIAAYIVKSANAYPRLVEALREAEKNFRYAAWLERNKKYAADLTAHADKCESVLRELGEQGE